MMPPDLTHVIVGVDTHADTHTAVVIDRVGRRLDQITIASTTDGYRQLLGWAGSYGELDAVGVEGTGAYGAGLARFLIEHGVPVVEVNRPNRQHRRRHGKSDSADAYAAAKAVLSGEASATVKSPSGLVEAVRSLHLVRRSAVKAKTQAGNQIKDLIVTAPDPVRGELRSLNTNQRVRLAVQWDTITVTDAASATRHAIATLARRWQALHDEIKHLEKLIWPLLGQLVPTLLAEPGVGLDVAAKLVIAAGENPDRLHSEAAFAALCGTSPVEATTGKQQNRHRLNRGGNRQANNALHTVVLCRSRHHSETRAYIERRRADQLTDREIWRCLKRSLARRFHHLLLHDLTNRPLM
jgi:transposase